MSALEIPIWKHAPFIRLLLPFSLGIMAEHYAGISISMIWILFSFSLAAIPFFHFFKTAIQFHFHSITGVLVNTVLCCSGSLLVYYYDITNKADWVGHNIYAAQCFVVKLEEPLSEKTSSFKTTASIKYLVSTGSQKKVRGKLLIYFQKDSILNSLQPGFEIIFRKAPERMLSSGNPGAFNYSNYAALQGIHYQVYLAKGEYTLAHTEKSGCWNRFINTTRKWLIQIIRKNIKGAEEAGLAEALLIGYKDDLDKSLLQSYSNTGVVHVIAISGLHLGLIYWLLSGILKPFRKGKRWQLVKSLIIISGLWVFSLLAGASPSVLRSALMFTFIVIGESTGRKTSIYNSLAASAFLLLCINPFWLWDAGFQLSYIAVLSLVIFMKDIYNCIFVKNKLLDNLWKISSVTLAAQILTFPLCVYLFHQFPNSFLITNLVAIPLSSIILLGEILLCCIAFLEGIAVFSGHLLQWLIILMNRFIRHIEQLPFSTIQNLELSFPALVLLYFIIISFAWWRMNRSRNAFFAGMFWMLISSLLQMKELYFANQQSRVAIYNLKGKAIELINGRQSFLITTVATIKDKANHQYCFQPAFISQRIISRKYITSGFSLAHFIIHRKSITMIQNKFKAENKIPVSDILIISDNPDLKREEFYKMQNARLIIFDGSNSPWKIREWVEGCKAAEIPYWSVAEKGAFILNLN